MRQYRFRAAFTSTIAARLINQTASLFSSYRQVNMYELRLAEKEAWLKQTKHKIEEIEKKLKKSKDKSDLLKKRNSLIEDYDMHAKSLVKSFKKLKVNMISAIKTLKNLIIDAETLLYREASSIDSVDSKIKNVAKRIEPYKKEHFMKYYEEFNETKTLIKGIMSAFAQSTETLKTGKLSTVKLREISLRRNARILVTIKRDGIEIFQLIKDIDLFINKLTFPNLISLGHKWHKELHDLYEIMEFGIILLHRFEKSLHEIDLTGLDEKTRKEIKEEIEAIHKYFKSAVDTIARNARLGKHEIRKLVA